MPFFVSPLLSALDAAWQAAHPAATQPLVVSGDPVGATGVENGRVETTQIAPTILRLLGLDPRSLQAVRIEGTRSLPLS